MESFTLKIIGLIGSLKGSILEALVGFYTIKTLKKENPEDCAYVRMAARKFEEEELDSFIEKMKEIVNEYEQRRSESLPKNN